jgi:hypothetical protein
MAKVLVCLETNAVATEKHQSFEVDEIIFAANDDTTNSVIFNFDESSGADTNIHGLDSVYMLYLDVYAQYVAHCAMGSGTHTTADVVNNAPATTTTKTVAAICAAIHALKDATNAHDAETGTYHPGAGTAHQVTAADPTTLSAAITCMNEISADLTDHMADASAHAAADTTNVITTANSQAGDMTVKKSEQHTEGLPMRCNTLYFKSSTGTVPFRIWGLKIIYSR